jgi:hypothetical protein
MEVACHFENGAVVVPAALGGIAGDYIFDPSAPQTLLHDTRAQAAGFADTALILDLRLAGRKRSSLPVAVIDLDDRSEGFLTPIAGVLGADALAGLVLDLQLTPCRLALYRQHEAPRFHGQRLAVTLVGGVPALWAGVADNGRATLGLFAIDTGSAAAVRLSDHLAVAVPPLAKPQARNASHAVVAALSFDDVLTQRATAGLAQGLDPALAGTLGNGVWRAWRFRLDIEHRRLTLAAAPRKKGPGSPPGP